MSTRRDFLRHAVALSSAATLGSVATPCTGQADQSGRDRREDDVQPVEIPGSRPLLDLANQLGGSVRVKRVELMQGDRSLVVRVEAEDGTAGYAADNGRLAATATLARQLVFPFFVGKDLRDLEQLVDDVYLRRDDRGSVYKFAGMPFWNAVGLVEVACFDLLGRRLGLPVHRLLGSQRRERVAVYISQFGRDTTAAAELESARRDLDATGARATKLKVGRRMHTTARQTARDRRMIRQASTVLGEDVTLYVDANGSYTTTQAIEMGRFLDDHGVTLFEEPLPWEDRRGTGEVRAALHDRAIAIAGGEQDSSLWTWRDLVADHVVDVLQPDVFYNGGLIRTLRVARMAAAAGRSITPHSPKVLPVAAAVRHLCAVVENLGEFQEARSYGHVREGFAHVPDGPGLGIDPATFGTLRAVRS